MIERVATISRSNISDFNEELTNVIKGYQNDKLEVEVQFKPVYDEHIYIYFTALVIGRNK